MTKRSVPTQVPTIVPSLPWAPCLVRVAAEPDAPSLVRYRHRLARGLAQIITLLDPDIIVLGGGLSRIASLYAEVPALWGSWVFSDTVATKLVPPRHGDSSGVRGAAWLWDADTP
jgi:fructokinase